MNKEAIEAGLKAIEQGIADIRAELSKEAGAEAAAPGNPGTMATPAKPMMGGPASAGLPAFLSGK